MSKQESAFSLRLEKPAMDKLKVLAAENKRSLNKQIEFAVEKYLESYEKDHGAIAVPEE